MAKRKNKKLEWYAFREDFNKNELERFNVLGTWFAEDILKRIKRDKIDSYDKLKDGMTSKDTIYQWRRVYVRENKSNVCPTLTANMGTGGHNVPLIIYRSFHNHIYCH